jgi:hypothetical protein
VTASAATHAEERRRHRPSISRGAGRIFIRMSGRGGHADQEPLEEAACGVTETRREEREEKERRVPSCSASTALSRVGGMFASSSSAMSVSRCRMVVLLIKITKLLSYFYTIDKHTTILTQ